MRVLLVKMSSLGDVVHALPAITDAAAHGVRFDWVVEEAFAAIPRLHPAVDQVLPIGWRRWRGNLPRYHRELNAFRARLRSRRYDLVLDAQGLVESAAVTAFARGTRKVGFSWSSAREAAATLVYDRRIHVAKGQHAIVRLRRLFAQALGYPTPGLDAELDYGISPGRLGSENGPCVLLHGTTWDSKLWPVAFWRSLAIRAIGDGFSLVLPVGSDLELARSRAIAGRASVRVWDRLPLEALIEFAEFRPSRHRRGLWPRAPGSGLEDSHAGHIRQHEQRPNRLSGRRGKKSPGGISVCTVLEQVLHLSWGGCYLAGAGRCTRLLFGAAAGSGLA